MGPSRQRRCHAIVQHAAVPNAATRGGLCVSVHMPKAPSPPPPPRSPASQSLSLLGRALQFAYPVLVWQAEEAVANLPLRLAVRGHCGQQVRRGTLGVLIHSL